MDPTNPFGAMSQTNPFAADPASMPAEEPALDSTPPEETQEEVDTVSTLPSFPDEEMMASNGIVSGGEVRALDAGQAEQSPPDSSDDEAEATAGGVPEQEVAVATNPFLSFSGSDAPKETDVREEEDTSDSSDEEAPNPQPSEALSVDPPTGIVDEGPVVPDVESVQETVAAPLPVAEEIMSSPSSPESVDDEVCVCVCMSLRACGDRVC